MKKKLISVVTGCYNEEENVVPLYHAIKEVFQKTPQYELELIFIDNCSTDRTQELLEQIAAQDTKVKVIFNSRNFGHIRSGYYALLKAKGDAIIGMASDFQDPPDMIPQFIEKWEEGNQVVLAVKNKSKENRLKFAIRKMYYRMIRKISEVEMIDNATGFGLYDRCVIEAIRDMKDPYPYFRGILSEVGFKRALVPFVQPKRERGVTKNGFFTLYDMAMLGITSNSKVPIRIATVLGFIISMVSLFVALAYFVLKLLFWNEMTMGLAPLVIGLFFFGAVQLFFIGLIGEYVCTILVKVNNRPLVIERKALNFTNDKTSPGADV